MAFFAASISRSGVRAFIAPRSTSIAHGVTRMLSIRGGALPDSEDDDTWRDIINLSGAFQANPWPQPKNLTASTQLPLEQLLPFFLLIAVTHLQCQMVAWYSPALAVLKKGRNLALVTVNEKSRSKPQFQTCTYFRQFFSAWKQQPGSSGNKIMENHAKHAYLMLSFMGKCNTLVSCFGLLVLKTLQSHVLTYGGERIVGWIIQDGHLDVNHESISTLEMVDVRSAEDIPAVAQSVANGQKLPASVLSNYRIGRNDIHVWLTFVTESGRIFDLDLSALQFGDALPFPCVLPVPIVSPLRAEPTAFQGICARDRILCKSVATFQHVVHHLIDQQVAGVLSQNPNSGVTTQDLTAVLTDVVDKTLDHAHTELPEFAADPNHFWNVLKDLQP